jgi:transcriptional regulator with XRE-family HTH domain
MIDSKGLKYFWIYDRLDIARATFYNYLNNKTQPTNYELKQIAQLLEVPMEELVGDEMIREVSHE